MKNMLGIWKKTLAVTISILLVTTSVNVPGLVLGVQAAQEKLVKKTVVTAFEMLEEEISEQSVKAGTSKKDIKFPESLRIQGKVITLSETEEFDLEELLSENEDAGWQIATPSDLTDVESGGAWKTARVLKWEVDPNESTSGEFRAENIGDIFSFIPVLSEKYIVYEELELPAIRVTVTEVDADNDVEAEAAQDGLEGAANADGTDAALSDPLAENVVVSEALDQSLLKAAGVKTATPSDMEKESVVKILDMPAFAASKVIDGVRISVTAEEGTFPEGAVLVVEKVPAAKEREAEAAVAEQREENQNVAVSYTFDIRVEDAEGNELQPEDGHAVQVSFSTAEIADGNLETNVYHITEEGGSASAGSEEAVVSEAGETAEAGNENENENAGETDVTDASAGTMTAEKLEVIVDEGSETAVAETDGFSLYTVEFTYNNLQYVMPGSTEVRLAEILAVVGLNGEASAVEVSNASLFSAEKKDGEWFILSHEPFSSDEWMKVTINGIVYEITVTDATTVTTWAALKSALETSGEITLGNNITISDADITNLNYLFVTDGVTATLNLNGKTLTGGGNNAVITVNSGGKLTIKNSIGGGVITGGNRSGNGGALEVKGTLILQSGTLSGNKAGYGGAVYVTGSNAKFTMTGGTISNNTGRSGGGGVSLYDKATFTMSGGTISGNVTSYRGGGVRITKGCVFTMSNGTITNNPPSGTVNVGGGVCIEAGGTFNMTGGKITNNSVNASGGGVYVDGDGEGEVGVAGEDGIFNMSGGEISGNNASSGGGIYEWHGGAVNISGSAKIQNNNVTSFGGGIDSNSGIVNISGGTISGNKADSAGGGIGFNGTLYLSGGTITNNTCGTVGGGINAVGKFYLQGAPNISGNKRGERDDNLYTTTITITGPLTNSTAIGVETRTPPTFDNGGILVTRGLGTTGSASYIKFKSDNDRYYLGEEVVDGVKEAVLYPKYIVEISRNSSYPNFTPTGTQTLYVKPGSAMTSAVFTADTGYGFSESYSVDTVGGIKTTRTSQSKVTVSGTPTGDTQLIQIRLTPAKILRTATVIPGSNMTRKSSSGQESQTVVSGDAIKSIIYTANSGYYFPEEYTASLRGITATRDSESQITVAGTPSNTVNLTLTDASLIPATAPTISTQPSNVSMTYGDTGKTVKVTATAPTGHTLSYQWYESNSSTAYGTAISGATSSTYTIPSTLAYKATPYYYYCMITAKRNDNSRTAQTKSTAAQVSVSKAALTVTAAAKSKTYGDTDPALTYTVTGLKNSDTMSGALTRVTGEIVGTYTINQGSLSAGNNYTISFTGATFKIDPAPLTVTAEAKSKTYGDNDPKLTYTATGFKNGDTSSVMSGTLSRVSGENYGTYAINKGTLSAGNNYTISFTGATFTIGKATLTVTAVAKSKTYGDADPALTYTATGFKNGDTVSVMIGELERAAGEDVGDYAISQGTVTAGKKLHDQLHRGRP